MGTFQEAYLHYTISLCQVKDCKAHRCSIRGIILQKQGLKVSQNSDCDRNLALWAFWAFSEGDTYDMIKFKEAYPHLSSKEKLKAWKPIDAHTQHCFTEIGAQSWLKQQLYDRIQAFLIADYSEIQIF